MRHLFSVLFFAWLMTLLVLSFYPDLPDTDVRIRDEWFRTDYLGHTFFYAILILLFCLWQKEKRTVLKKGLIILAASIGIVLGAATEAVQHFIPGRSVNPLDLMYNCLGIILGTVAFYFLTNRTRIRRALKSDTEQID